MTFDLHPKTEAGRRFVTAATDLIPALRETAPIADRDSTMSAQTFRTLQEVGIAAACVPQELGGWGLTSVFDWMLGIRALAQGDGAAAIAINMHLAVTRGMAQAYAMAGSRADSGAAIPLRAVTAGEMLICATATERGTDNLHPFTEATASEDGWLINGHKMFVTMSPLATHLAMNLRLRDEEGDFLATTMLPIDSPGLIPQDDWDALGMRGSGSQSIKFEDVRAGAGTVRKLGRWGEWSTSVLINRTLGNLTLVAAFLGIAEHARALALESLSTQKKLAQPVKDNPGVQQSVGELEIELTQCRGTLAQAGSGVDEWLSNAVEHPPSLNQAHELMQSYQAAKWVVNRGAISIVDKAMDLTGGSGFMTGNTLSQLYRDVRAGPFMQPHAAVDIRGYVGQVALGIYPES
jgi:alkylation response protein AidB-like acyl-CoA dehydrogenase